MVEVRIQALSFHFDYVWRGLQQRDRVHDCFMSSFILAFGDGVFRIWGH